MTKMTTLNVIDIGYSDYAVETYENALVEKKRSEMFALDENNNCHGLCRISIVNAKHIIEEKKACSNVTKQKPLEEFWKRM